VDHHPLVVPAHEPLSFLEEMVAIECRLLVSKMLDDPVVEEQEQQLKLTRQ